MNKINTVDIDGSDHIDTWSECQHCVQESIQTPCEACLHYTESENRDERKRKKRWVKIWI